MRECIDRNDARAKTSGARIVHACGFDSIPSDLGVFVVHALAKSKGESLGFVRLRFTKMKGRVSGGTAASAMAIAERIGEKSVRRILGNPHALDPEGARHSITIPDGRFPSFDETSGHWTGPFFMAPVNTRVVRRSAALLGYGEDFAYDEVIDTGPGPRGWYYAAKQSMTMMGLVLALGAARGLVKRFAPKPGEGPTPEERARGSFRCALDAVTTDGTQLRGIVAGGDPGYGETSKMLSESALSLAQDPLTRVGVLTPASCMGEHLVKRLRDAGMTFSAELA
jgi:short subunit dehydrogenase-like uncharacterized protein